MPEHLFSDIPSHVGDEALEYISPFLVGFVKFIRSQEALDLALAGSGTLVKVGSAYGILTAQHVLDRLPKEGPIGLILPGSMDSASHASRPIIHAEHTRRICFGPGRAESEGPDIGVMLLPSPDASWIAARKSFFNLELWRDRVLGDQREVKHQAYAVIGFPDEKTIHLKNEANYSNLKGFEALSYLSQIESTRHTKEFDYASLAIGYNNDPTDPPQRFQGISGGGLWHVELIGDSLEDLRVSRCVLSGVAFYESDRVNDKRLIVCHWRQSVYQKLLERVLLLPE